MLAMSYDCTVGAELVEGPADGSGFEAMPTVGRAVYSFGALLTMTGVGSLEYDFGGISGCGGALYEGIYGGIGGGGIRGGTWANFCCTWLYVCEPITVRTWDGMNGLPAGIGAAPGTGYVTEELEISASKRDISSSMVFLLLPILDY